ncbi:hypothetical protein RND81_06G196500 [Saponaria officinalis]|uniref:Chromo domain-containing protein n=1 Tax=Saponaria officinalis TaxID=3572 RepID=A0AAW1KBZ5_SAPOF
MRLYTINHHQCIFPYLPGEYEIGAVDRSLQKREQMIMDLKKNPSKAQHKMKRLADEHRSEREFAVGDWVWLKLQPYRQVSVQQRSNQKLNHKYSGPFQVKAKIGSVAYKLELPCHAQIHDTFHLSQLKRFVGTLPMAVHIPTWLHGQSSDQRLQPLAILDRRTVKHQNAAQVQYLVQWEGFAEFEATWEPAVVFEEQYPYFPIGG